MRLALVALACSGCSFLTHAGDYAVADSVCTVCAASGGLLHPPCPAATHTSGQGRTYFFAARAIDLGANPASWDAGYWVGRNQDCSDRPGGMPVLCLPTGSPPTPWVSLPGGVDNSLAAQTLSLVVDGGRLADTMQARMNAELDAGLWGLMLVITDWNGQSDDDAVGARLLYTRGLAGAPGQAPRWDGSDFWDAFYDGEDPPGSGIPDSPFKGGKAYVVGGKLVWDARTIEAGTLHLENNASGGAGAADLVLANAALLGDITEQAISHAALSGAWSGANAHVFPDFLAGRSPAVACAVRDMFHANELFWSGPLWADLPPPPIQTTPSSQACASASVGIGFEFLATGGVGSADPSTPPPAIALDYGCDGGA